MLQPAQDQSNHPFTSPSSHLQRTLEHGNFVLTLQIPSPLTTNTSDWMRRVTPYAQHFDAVLTSDVSDGAVAISSLAMAVLLKRVGIEAVVSVSGRDRNRLALQGDLLGLDALGIHTLLVDIQRVTRASLGQNADARLVTDLNGPDLLDAVVRLRDEGHFLSGAVIKQPPVCYAGALFSLDESIDIAALGNAQFLVTTPLFDVPRFIDTFAAFQSLYSTFLSSRPLLVSLPLLHAPAGENCGTRELDTQQITTSMEALRTFKAIRGFNFVVTGQAHLASLEQIVPLANTWR